MSNGNEMWAGNMGLRDTWICDTFGQTERERERERVTLTLTQTLTLTLSLTYKRAAPQESVGEVPQRRLREQKKSNQILKYGEIGV